VIVTRERRVHFRRSPTAALRAAERRFGILARDIRPNAQNGRLHLATHGTGRCDSLDNLHTRSPEGRMATVALPATARRNDRLFYSGMALAAALTVLVGFAPSYYLRGYFGAPAVSPVLHVHGLLFTGWIVLFVVQTALVAARRVALHRRLGVAGAGLAAAMVVMGVTAAIDAVHRGAAPVGVSPLSFLIIPLGDMALFAGFVGAAVWLRRRAEAHKRLMLLGTISILTAAVARWPGVLALGPPAFFLLTDLFILAGVIYDRRSRGRVHPVYIWGGLLIVVSQPLRLVLSGTEAWLAFARFITGG
jgi:hypothetical protein